MQEAIASGIVEPTAMCLSTVGRTGRPSSRMVLLRGQDEHGFVFFTNYRSRKGEELEAQGYACLNFWWGELERQIRIEGSISRVSAMESDAYWNSRPPESRNASAASPQSQVIASREELEVKVAALAKQYPAGAPRPANWGGYRLTPDYFEFWQGGVARMHDRLAYRMTESGWMIERLAP
jgi:pyridoxamine 5'-phosphate oxidase